MFVGFLVLTGLVAGYFLEFYHILMFVQHADFLKVQGRVAKKYIFCI